MTSKEDKIGLIKSEIYDAKHNYENLKDKDEIYPIYFLNRLKILEAIKIDLDRLEKLENESFELRQKLNTEEECVVMLEKAIDKYKKVIKILKQHIEVYIYFGQSTINVTDYGLIQEEYDLLKEVLEDEIL